MANAKYSNGRLFRILTGSPNGIHKQYSVGLRSMPPGQSCKGAHAGGITKNAAAHFGLLQPFFRNKKPQNPYLQILVFLPHLSSSSDLRILSSTQPSQISPMTDFRQVWCLHAYSGGTVRDSHPVFYSPVGLLPRPQALKRNIYLRI